MLLLSGSLYGRMPLRTRCAGRLDCGRELAAVWAQKAERSPLTKSSGACGPCKRDVTEQCLHTFAWLTAQSRILSVHSTQHTQLCRDRGKMRKYSQKHGESAAHLAANSCAGASNRWTPAALRSHHPPPALRAPCRGADSSPCPVQHSQNQASPAEQSIASFIPSRCL